MEENPLKTAAADDRHTDTRWVCRDCGSIVSTYNCNASLIAARPAARDWDWWAACDNKDCKNSIGEGYFQDDPNWTKRAPTVDKSKSA